MKTSSNKPSHRVYAVTKRGDKSYWSDIGAVWSHADGKGFNLRLDLLPMNGAEIVIREPKAQSDNAAGPAPAEFEGGF